MSGFYNLKPPFCAIIAGSGGEEEGKNEPEDEKPADEPAANEGSNKGGEPNDDKDDNKNDKNDDKEGGGSNEPKAGVDPQTDGTNEKPSGWREFLTPRLYANVCRSKLQRQLWRLCAVAGSLLEPSLHAADGF